MRMILITGASSGIGRAFALRYARAGDQVILVARDEARLKAVALECEQLNQHVATIIIADLSDPAAPDMIYQTLQEKKLSIDVLVNNAGFGLWGSFEAMDFDQISAMIQVHITALAKLTQLFLPDMRHRQQGKIVNIASVYSYMPVPLQAVYAATKSFVVSFSLALTNELRDSGITVTAVCPGMTESEFRQRAGIQENETSRRFTMAAETVADISYYAIERGKAVVIPGWKNKLFVGIVRYLPQRFLPSFVRWVVYTVRRIQPIALVKK
jgi:short-subunit dehydrogenase